MAETQTKTKPAQTVREAKSQGDVIISAERLPMPVGVDTRFGIDRAAWRALTDAVFPLAKTPGAIVLALAYCRARKLDIFKRVVHIVPMWNEALNRNVETVWPGIAEARITASRTGSFGGNDAVEFGEWIEKRFKAEKTTKKGKKISADLTMRFPQWAQMTVYRIVNGQRCAFVGPVIYFEEFFGYRNGLPVPNARWQRAPSQMLEKCAEAAALRRAYPEELGNEPVAEEMEGRTIQAGGTPIGAGETEPKMTDFRADRGVPKDGVQFEDPGEDDEADLEDGVEVIDQTPTSETVAAKGNDPGPKAERTATEPDSSRVPEAQGSPPAAAPAEGSDGRPEPPPLTSADPPADDDALSREVAVERNSIEACEKMVETCIASLKDCGDMATLKDHQRRVRGNIDSFGGVPASDRGRLRGKFQSACLEREREINRANQPRR